MQQGVCLPETTVATRNDQLLRLLGELIDAHTDTVQLITGEDRSELAWLAHCDYLRALQRLGRETLAHHDQRPPTPPLALAIAAALTIAVSWGRTAALRGRLIGCRLAGGLRPG